MNEFFPSNYQLTCTSTGFDNLTDILKLMKAGHRLHLKAVERHEGFAKSDNVDMVPPALLFYDYVDDTNKSRPLLRGTTLSKPSSIAHYIYAWLGEWEDSFLENEGSFSMGWIFDAGYSQYNKYEPPFCSEERDNDWKTLSEVYDPAPHLVFMIRPWPVFWTK